MVIEDQVAKVEKKLLRKPLTSAELAARCGFPHSRHLNHAIARMKRSGQIRVAGTRPTTYTKP